MRGDVGGGGGRSIVEGGRLALQQGQRPDTKQQELVGNPGG